MTTKRLRLKKKTCTECARLYLTTREHAQTCSPACRQRRSRRIRGLKETRQKCPFCYTRMPHGAKHCENCGAVYDDFSHRWKTPPVEEPPDNDDDTQPTRYIDFS